MTVHVYVMLIFILDGMGRKCRYSSTESSNGRLRLKIGILSTNNISSCAMPLMLHDHELIVYVHRLELESALSILFTCRDGISSISLFHLHVGVRADG